MAKRARKPATKATQKIRAANLAETKFLQGMEKTRAEGRAKRRLHPPSGPNEFGWIREALDKKGKK